MFNFKKFVCMIIMLLLTFNIFIVSYAQTTVYDEPFFYSFEDATNSPEGRGTCEYLSGNYYFVTEDYARTGTKSIGLGNVKDVITKHSYTSPLKDKSISIWLYDEMLSSDGAVQNQQFYLTGAKSEIIFGINTNTSKDKYYLRVIDKNLSDDKKNVTIGASKYSRSEGWHNLKFDVSGSKLTIYVDGTEIYTYENANDTSLFDITAVAFSIISNNTIIGGAYFDDLEIRDIDAPDFELTGVVENGNGTLTAQFSSTPKNVIENYIHLFDKDGNEVILSDLSISGNDIILTPEAPISFSEYEVTVDCHIDMTDIHGTHIGKNSYKKEIVKPIYESFEDAVNSPEGRGSCSYFTGNYFYMSEDYARTGTKSIALGNVKDVFISHDYSSAPLKNRRITMWMYDEMKDSESGNQSQYMYFTSDNNAEVMLGIDTNASSQNGRNYYYMRVIDKTQSSSNIVEGVTSVARTVGWHKLTIDIANSGITLYIDNTQVFSYNNITALTKLCFSIHNANNVVGGAYFDSLEIRDINNPEFEMTNAVLKPDGTVEVEFTGAVPTDIADYLTVKNKEDSEITVQQVSFSDNKLILTAQQFEKGYTVEADTNTVDLNGTHIANNICTVEEEPWKPLDDTYSDYAFASFEESTSDKVVDGFSTPNKAIKFSDNAFLGEKSVMLGHDNDSITKIFSEAVTDKIISIWMYDSPEKETSSRVTEYVALNYLLGSETKSLMVGISTSTSADTYMFRDTGDVGENKTPFKRSEGWHKITFKVDSQSGTEVYFNENLLLTSPNAKNITTFQILDSWGSDDANPFSISTVICYDCFEMKDINAPDTKVIKSIPENNEKDVFTGSDVILEFESAPDYRLFDKYLSVYKGEEKTDAYKIDYDGTRAIIKFDDVLSVPATYSVHIDKGYKNIYGFTALDEYDFEFETGTESYSLGYCKLTLDGIEKAYPYEAGKYILSTDVRCNTGEKWEFATVAVLYRKNKIEDVYYVQKNDISENTVPVTFELTVRDGEENPQDLKIKIFTLDSLSKMNKLTKNILIKGEN